MSPLRLGYNALASLERSITRECARFYRLKEGDTNVAFFKIHAAHRSKKNHIASLRVGDSLTTWLGFFLQT